jgi:Fe-S cluster biogenesis protein NfuA
MFDIFKKLFSKNEPEELITDPLHLEVKEVIDKHIKNFIEADGGKIKLLRVSKGVVYVQLSGACRGCPALNLTLKGLIQRRLMEYIPEIEDVRLEP